MKHIILILILLLGGLSARAENVVSVSSASGHPQDEVTLQVSLANIDAAVAFQAEIPLGSQLTYVAGSVALNPDRVTDHQVSAAVVNRSLRIYAFSLSLTPFVGNESDLLSFTLKLKNEPGDYALELNETKLSDAAGNALPVTTSNGMVTILSPKLQINTPSMDYGHVPIRSEYTQNASVTNVGNEPLVITSINFNNTVFNCPSFTETTLQPGGNAYFPFKFAPVQKGALTATATIVCNSIAGNGIVNLLADPFAVNEIHVGNTTGYCDSIVEVPISMNNMEAIMGFQIDMNLPQALEYVDFTLSNRKADHVSVGVFNEGLLRLMAYSASGSAFTGDDGVIGTVRFHLHGLYGNYYLNPTKAVLADANGEDALSAKYQGYINIRSPQINGNNSLSFGSTPVTETVTKEYVVRNNGNAQMRIDQVVFDQPDFSVAETFPMTIDQNNNTTLHVSYNRELKGDFSALMKIYSNDPQNGLKNVALSGTRYEPNNICLAATPMGGVNIALSIQNYSEIVAMQTDFHYPYQDYMVTSTDFQLTDRFANHQLYVMSVNDSTYRILVLSMQNASIMGNDGVVLNVILHPIGTPSEEEYTVSVSNNILSGIEGINLFTGEDATVTFSTSAFTVTQSTELAQGYNWWSTYIEQEGINGLEMLENSLGGNGVAIRSQASGYTDYYGEDYGWWGSLTSINNESSYRVVASTPCTVTMTGTEAVPSQHPITLGQGWTWIGYVPSMAMDVNAAMAGLTPTSGDKLKSQQGYSDYYGEDYGWFGSLNTIEPGMGLMYYSTNGEAVTFTYPDGNKGGELKANMTAEHNHWKPNIYAYPDNMTVMAVVELDGAEISSDGYELAAFAANGECRGSVKLMYAEPINRHVAFLTISGKDAAELSFRLYNMETNEEYYESEESLEFVANAIVGDATDLYTVHFRGTMGMDELANNVQVYPNPVNRGEQFSIGLADTEARLIRVEIMNALGAIVSTQTSTKLPASLVAPETTGVYTVKILVDNKTVYCKKLVIR
jgi:hypothetical protein